MNYENGTPQSDTRQAQDNVIVSVVSAQSASMANHEARAPLLSVLTPAYNESANLPILYARIRQVCDGLTIPWEWIVVDDHSLDDTFGVVAALAREDARVRAIRLTRNSGAHAAIVAGLQLATGECAIALAGDLQDPPETIPTLLERWRDGAQVVWAVRGRREGESASTIGFSRLYYFLMRRVIGMRDMPATGADFFLLDRRAIDAVCQLPENNVSLMALISWIGFRQEQIVYDKQARLHGKSGWNIGKKLKLVVDSVTSFSYLPIRLMSYVGFAVAFAGFLYALLVIGNAIAGNPTEGWSSLIVVVLVIGGLQMLMLGILGEYLWRALDESRARPRYFIEAETGSGASSRGSTQQIMKPHSKSAHTAEDISVENTSVENTSVENTSVDDTMEISPEAR